MTDLESFGASLKKEVGDIVAAVPKLNDGDPSNDGPAIREIAQSLSVILAGLGVAVATTVHTLQSLGVL